MTAADVTTVTACDVAALYVDPKGVYANLPGVDVWDEARDARLYAGPWPVVAHPPCARWCAIAHLVEKRYGYRVGEDDGCFEAALSAVRKWGGVLEHPAFSRAWKHFGLPRPGRHGWTRAINWTHTSWAIAIATISTTSSSRRAGNDG